MNTQQKRRELEMAQIISNQRCQICGALTSNVCGVCLEEDKLACFCSRHEHVHRLERAHMALWQTYGEDQE